MLASRYRGELNGSSRHFGTVFAHAPAGPVLSNCVEEYRFPWSAEPHDSRRGHQLSPFGDGFVAMFGHGPDQLAVLQRRPVHPVHPVHLGRLVHAARPHYAAAPSAEALVPARAVRHE